MSLTRRRVVQALAATAVLVPGTSVFAQTGTSTLAEIKKRGSLRVGVTQAPPWYSKDPASGQWNTGLGVSVGKAMAEDLGVKFEPVEVTWGTAIAALQSNKIDIIYIFDSNPEREMVVDFPKSPLLFYSLAVLKRDGLEIKSWEDLNVPSVRISVPQATNMDRFVTEFTPKANIQRFPGNTEALAAFQAGRADVVCLFHPALLIAHGRLKMGQIVVPTPVFQKSTSGAVRKEDDKAFLNWVDGRVADYYKSAKVQKWYNEYLVSVGVDPKTTPPIVKASE